MAAFRSLVLVAAAVIAPTSATGVSATGVSASGAGASSSESSPAIDATFVAMPELVVPIVDGDRAEGRLKIKIVLTAANVAAAARLKIAIPSLQESALASASEFARLRASPYKPVDVARLAQDMTRVLRDRNPDVARVLLVEVSARPA